MSVLSYLEELASDLNLADREQSNIDRSLETLKSRLTAHFGSEIKEKWPFGSYKRSTLLPRRADERSDVDLVAVFENTNGYKPQTFLNKLKRFAEERYSTSEVFQSSPTVVLQLNHIKFEIVPAYRSYGNLYIPAPASNFVDWMYTDPDDFNKRVDQKNKDFAYKVKPAIRLTKYWSACNGKIMSTYDLESDIIRNSFHGCVNVRDYFFYCIEHLNTYDLSQSKKDIIDRAKKTIEKVREYEQKGLIISAEAEVKKLVPCL